MASEADSRPPASSTAESSSAELFILAVSSLSIVNLVLVLLPMPTDVTQVVVTVDLCLSLVLLVDFTVRFRRGGRRYFVHERGWLDLIGSLTLPWLRLLRLFRMATVSTALRKKGPRGLAREFRANLAEGALFIIAFLVIIVLEFGAIGVVLAEKNAPGATIVTGGDALWWGVVSITTTGYGDMVPVTRAGRIVGVVVLVTGIGLLGILTGYLANAFISPRKRPRPVGPGERAATVAEVRRLLDEQEAALATIRRRLAELEPEG